MIGLTSAEARQRLAEFGSNAVPEHVARSWRIYLTKFWAPIPWMLEAAVVLELARGRPLGAALIAGLLLFNVTLGFIQERRANKALVALKQGLAPTALVMRDGEWSRGPAADLVPGDLIRLPLGAVVPADARIVSGAVMVDQSMLTGESVAVEAETGGSLYAGSFIRRGQAVAEVTATGSKTYFGRAAELVRIAHAESTEQAAILGVTRNLLAVNGAVAAAMIAYAYASGFPSTEVIRIALTALLATIPRTRLIQRFARPQSSRMYRRPNASCVSFVSIRRRESRRLSRSIRTSTSCTSSRAAFEGIAKMAATPANAPALVEDLARHGNRVIAVATGFPGALRLAGLIAISDPPRRDSARSIACAPSGNRRQRLPAGTSGRGCERR